MSNASEAIFIPIQWGFKLPFKISSDDQKSIIDFVRSQGKKAGFNLAEGGYVEPWYFYSLRTITNKSEIRAKYSEKVSVTDFSFRYDEDCQWDWVQCPITEIVKTYVDRLVPFYQNQKITRVQVALQRPQMDLPLHRDRVMGEIYADTGNEPYNPFAGRIEAKINNSQKLNRGLTVKIPITEIPSDNGLPILEIDGKKNVYNVEDNIFAINEIDIRHGSMPVAHYRGVISIDGLLDFAALSKLALEPIGVKETIR
ncbi:MAG: hypothetical protein HUU57_10265 [Bdellovibrio sp.]|nr:hypothetical protein [Bdellovibrio sp.]